MAYTTINDPGSFFNPKTYTGNDSTAAISVGLQPSLTWIKRRNSAINHKIYDDVRGGTISITSNNSAAQVTTDTDGYLNTFTSDGFTCQTGATSFEYVNQTGGTYASWNWKAGTTSGIVAGSQTITPSAYSINADAGFGIYKWSRTGASTTDYFSHGLGATPTIAIQKRTDGVQDWYVNFTFLDGTMDYMYLNKTDTKYDGTTTLPTSTNYYPKSPETGDYITYVFCPVKGYSKFGIYYGTANANGPVIDLGFRPAFVLVKPTNYGTAWNITDNRRPGYQPVAASNLSLNPNVTNATITEGRMQLMSNGFKLNSGAAEVNAAYTYMYMAFAESPIANSSGTANNAR